MADPRPSLVPKAALLFGAMIALSACAQSAPPAASATPAQPASEVMRAKEVGDVDGQVAAVSQAEEQLNRALGAKGNASTVAPPEAPRGLPPRKSGEGAAAGAKPGVNRDEAVQSGDACGTACAALASMERATTHLCDLAGEGDRRCEDARTRVRSAGDRVRASCPVCASN